MSKLKSVRVVAATTLAAVANGQSLNLLYPSAAETVDPRQRPLLRELVYGTLRQWPRLAGFARQLLKKPLKSKDADIHALILLGIYQLSATRVASHAAVSETVDAARKLKKPWATGLINGVLRSFMRDGESLESGLSEAERAALSDWLFNSIQQQWPEQSASIIAAAAEKPPMTLRVNLQQKDRASYRALLSDVDITAREGLVPSALTLDDAIDVDQLPGFAQGWVSVQDESAQLAAYLLNPGSGEHILDACAAPGGKTCHILEQQPKANLVAADISEQRLDKVRDNARRLQFDPVIICADAARGIDGFAHQYFDAIIADVPCSATGVLRRNPDIKLLRHAEDPGRFAKQQTAILEGLWPQLKPGGRLLYVTCSILEEENDAVVRHALENLPGAISGELSAANTIKTAHGLQRLPSTEDGDGLYFALIERHRD